MTIRKFFTLTAILFAAFSFVSCSSDDDEEEKKNDAVADKHEYVDLGLPSGTLWATCNVGASKPEELRLSQRQHTSTKTTSGVPKKAM